jgi:hypothetical protein
VAALTLLHYWIHHLVLPFIIIMFFDPQQGELMLRCILEATDGWAGLGWYISYSWL